MSTDYQCAIIREALDVETQTIAFREALTGIRTGRWAPQVEAVRMAYAAGGKDEAAKPKKLLPGILFSGTFSRRSAKACVSTSGLICADLDGLNEKVESWFEQIVADPHTLACFRSPTGSGLKVVFRIDPTKPHIDSFRATEHYMLEHFGLQVDEKCSDISRICFVSHDAELFEATDAEVMPYPEVETERVKEFILPARDHNGNLKPGDDFNLRGNSEVPDILRSFGWTHLQGKYWCRPGKTGETGASWEYYPNTFHVFSSSPETGFPSDRKGFDPFAVFTHLKCGGDWVRATRELGQRGWGSQSPRPKPLPTLSPPADHWPEALFEGELAVELQKRIGLQARPLTDFSLPAKDDPAVLIGNRWLSKGDIAILASTSGMGKSSLALQAAVTWGLGLPLFKGFQPTRPLKSLIFQAEDGDGDIAEVRLSLEHAMGLTPEQKSQVRENVLIVTDRVHRGLSFRAELKRQIELHKPDIVWVNPLLAFIGGDVNDSTDVGTFLREQLNSLNEPASFAYFIVHHTAKPPKERKERQWNEVMYEMAGSADLTNAARAVLSLQATDQPGQFLLKLAKRGQRAGLTTLVPGTVNPDLKFEQPTQEIHIRHSKERMIVDGQDLAVIHWERFDGSNPVKRDGGRPSQYHIGDFLKYVPEGPAKALPAVAIFKYVTAVSGISRSGFKNLLANSAKDGDICLVDKLGLGPCFYKLTLTDFNRL